MTSTCIWLLYFHNNIVMCYYYPIYADKSTFSHVFDIGDLFGWYGISLGQRC